MRFILFLMGLIFFCDLSGQSNGSVKKTDIENEELKGKVKLVKKESGTALFKDGKIVLGKRDFQGGYSLNSYNEEGYFLESKEYDSLGQVCNKGISSYNANKKLKSTRTYNEKDSLIMWCDYIYTNEGKLLKEKWGVKGAILWAGYKSYDEKGNLVEDTRTDGSIEENYYKYDTNGNRTDAEKFHGGKFLEKTSSVYNEKGNLIMEKIRNDYRSSCDSSVYVYNKAGKLSESRNYSNGSFVEKVIYVYDIKGNCVETASRNSKGFCTWKHTWKFNTMNLEIENKYYTGGKLAGYTHFAYNVKRQIMEENTIYNQDSPGIKYKIISSYDEVGNWVQRIVFENNVPHDITLRTITYF